MNCYVHPEKGAVGTCVGCGKFICEECRTEVGNKNYCKSCVSELVLESKRKLERLEENRQPMVFMNAGGGGGGGGAASSSSSGSSSSSSAVESSATRLVRPIKNKVVAGLLAIFLGGIGVHKFYLGKPFQGILYLLFCWTGIPALIAFIEGIIYLASSDESFAVKYGAKV